MKILIVNRFFGGAQIPTGRMAEDVAHVLVECGHQVTALASTGTYSGAEKRARDHGTTGPQDDPPTRSPRQPSPAGQGALDVESVQVPKWMPRALAWVWFTWQARRRIPWMDWDVCVLMTDPPLLPLLAAKAACGENRGLVRWPQGNRVTSDECTETEQQTKHRAKRQVAVWLMDLYPEALAASGRITKSNPIYTWYFGKRQRALSSCDLLICLGHAQKELLGDSRVERGAWSVERGAKSKERRAKHGHLAERVRTAVVPPWDDRGNIALATEKSLRNLVLYAGNLGEAHCFEEILAAAPYLPGDWTIRFAVRGAKLSALKEKAKGISHRLTRIDTDGSDRHAPPGRGEKLVPDDLGTRNSPSDKETAEPEGEGVFGHSRPQGDRQLGELSEAVKLTRMKGRISPPGSTDRTVENAHAGGPPALAVSPPSEEAKSPGATIEITGYASEEETPELLASARVHLITMSPGWEGIVVPSKLYGCIRTGRPVLFIGPENADTAREVRAHDWGKVLPAGASGEEVAAAILELAARPTRATQSENGAREIAKLLEALATDRHG